MADIGLVMVDHLLTHHLQLRLERILERSAFDQTKPLTNWTNCITIEV